MCRWQRDYKPVGIFSGKYSLADSGDTGRCRCRPFILGLLQLMAYSCVVFSLTFKIKDTWLMNLQSCKGSQQQLMHFCPISFKQRVVWEIICIVAGDCSLTIHDVDGAIDEGLWQCGVTSSSPELQDSLVSAPARLAVQGGFLSL